MREKGRPQDLTIDPLRPSFLHPHPSSFLPMPVLKASTSPVDAVPFNDFSLTDIEREAASLLEGAKRRSKAILERAREEAVEVREQARQEGYDEGKIAGHADGFKQGQEEGRKDGLANYSDKLGTLAEAIDGILRTFNAERERLAASAGSEVPHLAVAIADRVVKRAGAFDPNVCIANSTAALRLVMRAHDVKLNVHPDDYESIKTLLPELGRKWPALTHVDLVEDANLTRGGCRVYTEGGLVDADLQEQLDRIAADLIPDKKTDD